MRQRAGYLSALSKLYKSIQRLVDIEGSTEDALELQEKLNVRYAKYLESHETALASQPEREVSLNESHLDIGKRHREAAELLQTYLDDGNKSERSMLVQNLFSSKSSLAGTFKTASTKHSSKRSSCSRMSNSDRLSEARIQAELAKKNAEQQQLMQEAHQKRLAVERETTRQRLEFERQASQRKAELDREATRRQLELEEQARQRSLL